jgi:hypothetical protein
VPPRQALEELALGSLGKLPNPTLSVSPWRKYQLMPILAQLSDNCGGTISGFRVSSCTIRLSASRMGDVRRQFDKYIS